MASLLRGFVLAFCTVALSCGGKSGAQQSGSGGPTLHALSVAVIGSGTVTSTPSGIACGASCSASFAHGTSVALSAAPASGYSFSGWDGACTGTAACTVMMNGDASVTARFTEVPPPPAQVFTVTVQVHGAGSVASSPAGIDCDGQYHSACTAEFSAGTSAALTATPAAGWKFGGWSGPCASSGTQACPVSADASVIASFDQLPPGPPPPGRRNLTVAIAGQGTVVSTPAGIACMSSCSTTFPDGTVVQLAAQPSAGWQLSGFSGACSGSSCTVTMSSDQTVTATFAQPPPPTDECAGLLPPSPLPASIDAVMPPQGSCIGGSTSDDGNGTFALGYESGSVATSPNYQFFQIQNGQAVRVGDEVRGSDEGGLFLFSQPSGFSAFRVSGSNSGSTLFTYGHDGVLQSSRVVVSGGAPYPSSAVGIDPSGGTAVARHYQNAQGAWVTTYQRLDKTGAAETPEVVIDQADHPVPVNGVGVVLSGDALVMEALGGYLWQARWISRAGSPLTDWFTIQGNSYPMLKFLMDGGIALGFGYPSKHWSNRIADGSTSVEPAPAWLAQRSAEDFAVVRKGKAYTAWGPGGQCADGFEVFSTSTFKSCGCAAVRSAGTAFTRQYLAFGRDSSLLVPNVSHGCTWELYPQLMK